MTGEAVAQQRLDKWLWFARVVKTRSLASRLVGSGKARVNRARVTKASHPVREGDVVTVAVAGRVRVLKVVAAGARRGPAPEARLLYEDLTPAQGPYERPRAGQPGGREPGAGRPTKRDRRVIDAWTGRGP